MNQGGPPLKTCPILSKEPRPSLTTTHFLCYPLTLAIAVLYGRPFKQRKGIRLHALMVPEEYEHLHETIIVMRDKVFAHTDIDAPRLDEDSMVNELVIHAWDGFYESEGLSLAFRNLEEVRQLSKIMAAKCGYHIEKLWYKYMGKHPIPDGTYKVNLSDEGPFLLPAKRLSR